MSNPNLSKLSDDELAATIVLLGEKAQEISNASALVRLEQQARTKRAEDPVVLGNLGASTLADCVSAAPAKVAELAEAPAPIEPPAAVASVADLLPAETVALVDRLASDEELTPAEGAQLIDALAAVKPEELDVETLDHLTNIANDARRYRDREEEARAQFMKAVAGV